MKKRMDFKKYKKLVESIKYKDFSIFVKEDFYYLKYMYTFYCPNWKGSGKRCKTINYNVTIESEIESEKEKHEIFNDCPTYYHFVQLFFKQFTKKQLFNVLKKFVDNERYNKNI